jgi:CRISPR-associated protein Cst1
VKPVLFDIALREWIDNHPNPDKQSQQQLVELLKQSKRYPSREWEQPIKKMAPEEIHAFLNGKLRCSFEDEWFATMHFEEMVFGPLGISGALFNFNWDLEQHPMPISSWIRLVLFLAPVGLTRFTRYYRDEFETYYSFVYRDGTPQTIYEDNNELENLERNESFERLIPKLVQRQAFKARREHQPNIQVIEFYSDLGMRKTVMNYYHIPRHMIVYFSSNLNRLQYLHRPIRDPFLHLVMESVDPIPEIWRYMHKVILGQGQAYSAWLAVRERWVIQELKKKEGAKMTAEELRKKAGLIYHISQEGVKIRKGLERRADRQAESTDYVSSGGKRAAGIAHRLLNAAKARDKHQFLDTTIRLYLSVGEPVPNSLLNVLHEERVDFNTWAGAFIAGLLGADPSEKSDETATDEHAVNE